MNMIQTLQLYGLWKRNIYIWKIIYIYIYIYIEREREREVMDRQINITITLIFWMLSSFAAISSNLWKRFSPAHVLNYASSKGTSVCVCVCVCVRVCVCNSNPLDGLLGQWYGVSETWGFNPKTYAAFCLPLPLSLSLSLSLKQLKEVRSCQFL